MAVLAGLALIGAIIAIVVVSRRYRAEQREGARVRALFSRYVSPPIVDELLSRKDPQVYTGRSLRATIVVCRIWNFAGFAESLTAEETLRYLNELFALTGTSIQKHRGIVDKFLADGIIGVFGVPVEDPAAEEHALRAALDIVRLVHAMEPRWRAQGRGSFQVGIGISSGQVVAGDAGFHERREFTVVGPEMLFAARLQEATADLKAFIVAAATTCDAVRGMFALVALTGHPLPGLKRLADAFVVLGLTKETETLTMPGPGAFRKTLVETAVPKAAAVPDAAPKQSARVTPAPPKLTPLPSLDRANRLAPLHPRHPAESAMKAAFALPIIGAGRRNDDRDDDDAPAFPEPPAAPAGRSANSAYEDGDEPPFRLAP